MDYVFEQIEERVKDSLIPLLMEMLRGMFDSVNTEVGNAATCAATDPSAFNPTVLNVIKSVSDNAIMPIAGMVLTFVACYELIQMIMNYNNLANFESWFIFRWIIKTFVAVELITHVWDFALAVFDLTGVVISEGGIVISGSTAVDASALAEMESTIEAMSMWGVMLMFIQVLFINIFTFILAKIIFVIVQVRMIEIYLHISVAPIPFSTLGNKEQGVMGQSYIRGLFALGFQGFLILICIGIYAAMIRTLTFSEDIIGSIWGVLGYTILLAYSLFKTETIAKTALNAH